MGVQPIEVDPQSGKMEKNCSSIIATTLMWNNNDYKEMNQKGGPKMKKKIENI